MSEQSPLTPRGPARERTVHVERVALTLDVLKAIEHEMSQLGAVTVKSKGWRGEAPSVDAFIAEGVRELPQLTLTAGERFRTSLFVTCSGGGVAISTVEDDDPRVDGVASAVERVCRQHSRRAWERVAGSSSVFFALAMGALALSAFTPDLSDKARGVYFIVALGLFALSGVAFFAGKATQTRILLTRRDESRGWWAANRDALILQTYGVLGGGVAGFIVGRLTGG